MRFYLAPLEGITTSIYRRTYHKYFFHMDKYFSPFLSPHTKRDLTAREKKDILPENNRGMYLVPQILSNNAKGFVSTAKKLGEYGYREVNLNLGCPSRTVVSRRRGAGFLAYPEELERFLDAVFSDLDMEISIKTRIGKDSPGEFEDLLSIYDRFPLKELIVHPRTQKDFYRNRPDLHVFAYAAENSRNPLCYNGDLFTPDSIRAFREKFPETDTVMIGRGILANPGLLGCYAEGKMPETETLRAFHDDLLRAYAREMSGDRNVLFKMKELWSYWIHSFPDGEKYGKQIRKSTDLARYEAAVDALFSAAAHSGFPSCIC